MLRSLRTQHSTVAATLFTILLFIATQALGAMGTGRLLPNGQVKVYRGDQLVSVLSEEAPRNPFRPRAAERRDSWRTSSASSW